MARRREVSIRGAAPPAVTGAEMVVADTFLRRPVEVVVSRDVELLARRDDRLDQLVLPANRRAPQRAAEAVEGGVAPSGVLEPLEVR